MPIFILYYLSGSLLATLCLLIGQATVLSVRQEVHCWKEQLVLMTVEVGVCVDWTDGHILALAQLMSWLLCHFHVRNKGNYKVFRKSVTFSTNTLNMKLWTLCLSNNLTTDTLYGKWVSYSDWTPCLLKAMWTIIERERENCFQWFQ